MVVSPEPREAEASEAVDVGESVLMVALTRVRFDSRVQRAARASSAIVATHVFTLGDGSTPFETDDGIDHTSVGLGRAAAVSVRGSSYADAPKASLLQPILTSGKTFLRPLWFTWKVLRSEIGSKPSIVYCHDYDTLIVGLLFKALRGARIVYDSHEFWPEKTPKQAISVRKVSGPVLIERFALRHVDEMLVVSDGIRDQYTAFYPKLPAVRIVRNVPNHPNQPPSDSCDQGERVLMMVGAISPHRGLEVGIRAINLLPKRFCLRIVGTNNDPRYLASLEEIASANGVADRVRFEDPREPAELPAYLSATGFASLVLIEDASASYAHTLPNKFFESIAAGLPVVVTPLAELKSAIDDLGCGIVASEATPTGVAEAVLEAEASAPGLRLGVERAQERYSWTRESRTIHDAIVAALRGAGRSLPPQGAKSDQAQTGLALEYDVD